MKDLHKNPTLYYILVPILVGFWPLLVWAMYLPDAEDTLKKDMDAAKKGQSLALQILVLDPERADTVDANSAPADFSYAKAVYDVALKCDIASKYNVSTGPVRTTKDKQKIQTGRLKINEIGVAQLARFIALIQYRWGTLQCDDISLTKVKAEARPDVWTVVLNFTYYF
jgi:hypothetical protein